jgi:peptidoglycan hydrolase-like protein with peptidoglycan-binding domain
MCAPAPGIGGRVTGITRLADDASLAVTASAVQPGHFSVGGRGGRFIPWEILADGPVTYGGLRRPPLARTAVTSSEEEPLTTSTISPWPLVRQGDQHHPVETLQYLLRARGRNLTVDGIFGPATDAAVRAFQQQRGLAVDGVVGPATWSALISTVRQGSQGDAVRGVQEEFRFRDLSGNPDQGLQVDGIFGPRTEAAVRGFQQALHQEIPSVTVDGIVGPVTWQALVSGMLSA